MRTDWVPFSAASLVTGSLTLLLGALLNPLTGNQTVSATLRVAEQSDGRWLGMAVMYFLASVCLTLGLPAMLSLFVRRGRRVGLVAVGVFAVGTIGLSGFAMLLVFLRTLVITDLLVAGGLDRMTEEVGLTVFLYGWIAGFYLGAALVAWALVLSRKTPLWVPLLVLVFVVAMPFASSLGRVGSAAQVMALVIAFTAVAMTAVSEEHKRDLHDGAVF